MEQLTSLGFKNNGMGIWSKGNVEFWKSGFTGKYIYKESKNSFLKPDHIFDTVEQFIELLNSK